MARILVIDDSATMRTLVQRTLELAGHQVSLANDGLHALEVASPTAKFDLFLCDINMPRLDGLALIKHLRALAPFKYTPILVLTTEIDAAKKKIARDSGATGWLVKPFEPDLLLGAIKKALG